MNSESKPATATVDFFPSQFPPKWASEWGEDEYGIWLAFDVRDVRQAFRWIAPGTFLMGSPEGGEEAEVEREDDETRHPVTLTEGYWLADTACTQKLWTVVMGENPAHFKGDETNPVEEISWDDVQEFLSKLNILISGLDAGLPTEAQWECACRAGTVTPFSFGDNITPDQVNYDGNYPYAAGEKGAYREKTVPVKSFPPNAWGLFEMHGNVLEWCQDWYAEYEVGPEGDPIENPQGPEEGDLRVLRGGSWVNYGRDVRSADRNMDAPGYRRNDIGFRLAPGQAGGRAAEPHSR